MKKLTIVFAVLMSFTMGGCLVKDSSAEIVELKEEIVALKDEKKNDYFQKNIECQQYLPVLQKEKYRVRNIFYSAKEKACLYVDISGTESVKVLVNFFTSEEIIRWVYFGGDSVEITTREGKQEFKISETKKFEELIKEYQENE